MTRTGWLLFAVGCGTPQAIVPPDVDSPPSVAPGPVSVAEDLSADAMRGLAPGAPAGVVDPNDVDGDGTPAAQDCDDNDPSRNQEDHDLDGVTTCDPEPDCDDHAPWLWPGAWEACDRRQNDCRITDWTPLDEERALFHNGGTLPDDVTANLEAGGTFQPPVSGTLELCRGDWSGSILVDGNKTVTVRGADGAQTSRLTHLGGQPQLQVTNGATVRLENVVVQQEPTVLTEIIEVAGSSLEVRDVHIQGVRTVDGTTFKATGTVIEAGDADVLMEDVLVTDTYDAVIRANQGSVTMRRVTIEGTPLPRAFESQVPAAIQFASIYLTIEDSVIRNWEQGARHIFSSDVHGGVILGENATVSITGTDLIGNHGTVGISSAIAVTDSSLTLHDCTIEANGGRPEEEGDPANGAVVLATSSLLATDTVFRGNRANSGLLEYDRGGQGGAVYLYRSDARFERCLFDSNVAAHGSAIYARQPAEDVTYSVDLEDTWFIDNAALDGAAVEGVSRTRCVATAPMAGGFHGNTNDGYGGQPFAPGAVLVRAEVPAYAFSTYDRLYVSLGCAYGDPDTPDDNTAFDIGTFRTELYGDEDSHDCRRCEKPLMWTFDDAPGDFSCDGFTCGPELFGHCGDGVVDAGETCDDGNLEVDDGCNPGCTVETCGDGFRQTHEGCDDGNLVGGDGCDASCTLELCGDGIVQGPREACDDGNTTRFDGCSAQCQLESCGNGEVEPGEGCDDGNLADGDGCDSACEREPLSPFVRIHHGDDLVCGLRADGTATCWGALDNSEARRLASRRFKAIDVGFGTVCGQDLDDEVHCYGKAVAPYETRDYAWTNTLDHWDVTPEFPWPVDHFSVGLYGVVGAAGDQIAMREYRPLYNGITYDMTHVPSMARGPFKDVALSMADRVTGCVVESTGNVLCFGDTWGPYTDPQDSNLHWRRFLGDYEKVEVVGHQMCALDAAGMMTCFDNDGRPIVGVPSGPLQDVQMIYRLGCGLTTAGYLQCWDPTGIAPPPPTGVFDWVEAGIDHMCAGTVADGAWQCWRRSSYEPVDDIQGPWVWIWASDGVLSAINADGQGAVWEGVRPAPNTEVFRQGGPWLSVKAGQYGEHACGLDVAGEVTCVPLSSATTPLPDPPDGPFVDISVGDRHACGLRADGSYACWGDEPVAEVPDTTSWASLFYGANECGLSVAGRAECYSYQGLSNASPNDTVWASGTPWAITSIGADGVARVDSVDEAPLTLPGIQAIEAHGYVDGRNSDADGDGLLILDPDGYLHTNHYLFEFSGDGWWDWDGDVVQISGKFDERICLLTRRGDIACRSAGVPTFFWPWRFLD